MRLTKKLLGFLNKVFDVEPSPFLALRLQYDGEGVSWTVRDGTLTITPSGGIGASLEINLKGHTLQSMADYIADQDGYTISHIEPGSKRHLCALVLLDGDGGDGSANGDRIYGYESLLYSFYEANAVELALAEEQIDAMPAQMNVNEAETYWLDVLGGYYGVPRTSITVESVVVPETDTLYGPRIIQEVLRPRSNNIALELAIEAATGWQTARVVDAPLYDDSIPRHDSSISYDGENFHNSTAKLSYNLFDVEYQYDLEGTEDIGPFAMRVLETIEKFRAGGTHLRSLVLRGSQLSDVAAAGVDSLQTIVVSPSLSDSSEAPEETVSALAVSMTALLDVNEAETLDEIGLDISYSTTFNGFRAYDGSIPFGSGETLSETL